MTIPVPQIGRMPMTATDGAAVGDPRRASPAAVQLSVVIPTYNEAPVIGPSLITMLKVLGSQRAMEVIVVDDGSADQTAELVAAHADGDPRIRLIRQPRNLGKGAAVRAGMLAARGDAVCFIDADLPVPLDHIERMLGRLAEADIVIASRGLAGSGGERRSWIRTIASWMFQRVVRRAFGLPYSDTQCGAKCFRHPAALELFRRARSNGFAFDVEILALARALGFTVQEVPVQVEQQGLSSVRIAAHGLPVLGELWRIHRAIAAARGQEEPLR